MASDPKNQKKDSSKLMLILAAGGGLVVVIGIVIAILNTYTEVFEDALKPEPKKKPKKTMDFAKPKDVSDNTPAKKFTDEVMEAYPNLLQVSAQITLGSVALHRFTSMSPPTTSTKRTRTEPRKSLPTSANVP